jgi:hypothetical protein
MKMRIGSLWAAAALAIVALVPAGGSAHKGARHVMSGGGCVFYGYEASGGRGLFLDVADDGKGFTGAGAFTWCSTKPPIVLDGLTFLCIEIVPVYTERPPELIYLGPTHMLFAQARTAFGNKLFIRIHDRYPDRDLAGASPVGGSGPCGAGSVAARKLTGDFSTGPAASAVTP